MGCKIVEARGFTAFVCGAKEDHDCDSNEHAYTFSDGSECTLLEKAKEQKLNLNMCDEDKLYFLEKKSIYVRGWSVKCSICGRSPSLEDFYSF